MQNAGIVVDNGSTLVTFVSFNVLNKNNLFAFVTASGSIGGMLPALVALLGVIAIAILSKKNVKGAILWGILGSAIVYYILAGIGYAAGSEGCKAIFEGISISNPIDAFAAWGKDSVGKVF